MSEKIKILYLSTFCSEKVFKVIHDSALIKPRIAGQKFNGMLLEGLALNFSNCEVESISAIPITAKSHKKRIWFFNREFDSNLRKNYIPLINIPFIKELVHVVYVFFSIVLWRFFTEGKNKIIICDILNLSNSIAVLFASRLLGIRTVAVVTDVPHLMLRTDNHFTIRYDLFQFLVSKIMAYYDSFVFVTVFMNNLLNTNNKPYIIIEGLVNLKDVYDHDSFLQNEGNREIVYTGGLFKEYGVDTLIHAFKSLRIEDLSLHIYGDGDMVDELKEIGRKDPHIIYKGVVLNFEARKAQRNAILLINPRPSNLDLAPYSFPSKILEYMVSGSPVLTTKLRGIPEEYFEYLYTIDNEDVIGVAESLRVILELDKNEREDFGLKAKKFVLENKNNKIQSEKLLLFLKKL